MEMFNARDSRTDHYEHDDGSEWGNAISEECVDKKRNAPIQEI